MAKKNDIAKQARRKFVQARASATGKTDADAKAKFRARFDKLIQTKEGRQQIANVTGMSGIKKALAASAPKPAGPKRRDVTLQIQQAKNAERMSSKTWILDPKLITPQIEASVDKYIGNMDPRFSGVSPTTTIAPRMQNPNFYLDFGGSPEDYGIIYGNKKGK